MKKQIYFVMLLFCLLVTAKQVNAQDLTTEEQIAVILLELDSGKQVIGEKVNFRDINFEFGSAKITEGTKSYLDAVVLLMSKTDNINLVVEGHTDNVGSEETNEQLSLDRAKAVVDYLVSKGIEPSRLSFKGLGSTMPIASNDSQEGRERNRRVEMEIIALKQEIKTAQDIVYLTDNTTLGVRDLEVFDQYIRYRLFTSDQYYTKLRSEVRRVTYADGTEKALYVAPQPEPEPEPEVGELNSTVNNLKSQLARAAFYVKFGTRYMNVDAADVDFYYRDESPMPEDISSELSIEDSNIAFDFALGLELEDLSGWIYSTDIEFFFGEVDGLHWNLGAGRVIKKNEKFQLNLLGHLGFGSGRLRLGDLQNRSTYIQVNDTQFYDNALTVKLRNNFVSFRPQVTMVLPTSAGLFGLNPDEFRITLGYNQVIARSNRITFNGTDENDEIRTAKEKLSEDNVSFRVNDRNTDDLPFSYNGPFFSIGLGFH